MSDPEIENVYLPPRRATREEVQERAEAMAQTLPPEQRAAAIERFVEEVWPLTGDVPVRRAKIRVEVPANLHPHETNVYLDDQKLGDVVAVRFQTRGEDRMDTYVVLRLRDADVQWPEAVSGWEFGRLDMSMRTVKGFEMGTSVSPRSAVDLERARDRASAYETLHRLGLSPEDLEPPSR